jgi:hypothetical protein
MIGNGIMGMVKEGERDRRDYGRDHERYRRDRDGDSRCERRDKRDEYNSGVLIHGLMLDNDVQKNKDTNTNILFICLYLSLPFLRTTIISNRDILIIAISWRSIRVWGIGFRVGRVSFVLCLRPRCRRSSSREERRYIEFRTWYFQSGGAYSRLLLLEWRIIPRRQRRGRVVMA